jgi:hypothetical protein
VAANAGSIERSSRGRPFSLLGCRPHNTNPIGASRDGGRRRSGVRPPRKLKKPGINHEPRLTAFFVRGHGKRVLAGLLVSLEALCKWLSLVPLSRSIKVLSACRARWRRILTAFVLIPSSMATSSVLSC